MRTVKELMQLANPVPERPPGDELSRRALDELAALPAASATAGEVVDPRRRRRRLVGLVGAAVVAVALAGVGAVLVTGAGPEPPSGAEPFYADTRTLQGRADLIVRGTVEKTRERDRSGTSETIATVRVSHVAKGETAEGRPVEIIYTTPGSGPAETPDGLRPGGDYVLLLERVDDAPANLLSSIQGYYPVSGGRAVPDPENPVDLSPEVKRLLGLG